MAELKIFKYPAKELRVKCKEVNEITEEVIKLLDDMSETLEASGGIGLAGSQVGSDLRVVVMNVDDKKYQLINPKIIRKEGEHVSEEGCLSVPGVWEYVRREKFIEVEALDKNGEVVNIKTNGVLSICLQHEIDHLNGIVFVDYLNRSKRRKIDKKFKKR